MLLQMLEPAGHGDEQVISATRKLQDPQRVPDDWLHFFSDTKCRRWLFKVTRLVNERVIDVGLKKDVNALQVGFQQSSIETTWTQRDDCWHTDRADVEHGRSLEHVSGIFTQWRSSVRKEA